MATMTASRPKVSDEMVTISGRVCEPLRQMLELSNCVLRRTYSADTGVADQRWVAISIDRIDAILVHRTTVERWVREQWADAFHDSPRGYSPNIGYEWVCLRRCERCRCVGYPTNGFGMCDECDGIED